ncbi:GreA/GreB family elongation factor [Nocardia paucivorans]|uniref:GreA/GreB family elongation factor n=1 Tax=Nocardia paucivorans TaxID=114259 RepID=UPI00030821EA|nr:GreA/GreB family elongation factor [Nocardia paucivorans]
MTGSTPVWLTAQAYEQLQAELTHLLASDTPDDRETPDQEYEAATRHRRRARIHQIRDLLSNAVVGQDPPDDGIAEPGMVLTVRYNDTDDTETFLLGAREVEYDDLEVYSPESPLGSALIGARRGEQRTYRVPNGATVQVTLLDAVPYGHAATTAGRASASAR